MKTIEDNEFFEIEKLGQISATLEAINNCTIPRTKEIEKLLLKASNLIEKAANVQLTELSYLIDENTPCRRKKEEDEKKKRKMSLRNYIQNFIDSTNYLDINKNLIQQIGFYEAILMTYLVSLECYFIDVGSSKNNIFQSNKESRLEETCLPKEKEEKAFKKLQELGLIEIIEKGLVGKQKEYIKINHKTLYSISTEGINEENFTEVFLKKNNYLTINKPLAKEIGLYESALLVYFFECEKISNKGGTSLPSRSFPSEQKLRLEETGLSAEAERKTFENLQKLGFIIVTEKKVAYKYLQYIRISYFSLEGIII